MRTLNQQTGEIMKITALTWTVLFLSSVSQALYVPGNGNEEKLVYKCANEIVQAEVSRNFEGEFKLRMVPLDAGIINLYLDEKVHDAETPRARVFTSKKVVLKIENSESGTQPASMMVALNSRQVERMQLDCRLIYTIMQQPIQAYALE